MGWASGSRLFAEVIKAVQSEVPDEAKRKTLYLKMIPAFEDADWDTQDECMDTDPAYDEALKSFIPAGMIPSSKPRKDDHG